MVAVFMDFNRNPVAVHSDLPFSLDRLDDDVRAYLENNDALAPSPIERLQRMNPLSISLYKMHGYDLTTQPLQFAMNNQHMNGGIEVDIWGQTSLPGCFAVGEVAGTHGVTRRRRGVECRAGFCCSSGTFYWLHAKAEY